MPLTHLLYRCPRCGHDPLDGEGDEAWCESCGFRASRGGEGGRLQIIEPGGGEASVSGHRLAAALDPEAPRDEARTARVEVRRGAGQEGPVIHRQEVLGFAEELGDPEEGVLELNSRSLTLWDTERRTAPRSVWAYLDIQAVQTTSSALQISPATGGVVHFRFLDDSPRRWEELLHARIRAAFRKEGRGEVLEFQPRIVAATDRRIQPAGDGSETGRSILPETVDWEFREPLLEAVNWYGLFRALAGLLMRLGTRTRVAGTEHVPSRGPFILVSNHQSVLDPILVQVSCPRPIHTLTKSTQFGSGIFRWLLPRLNAIPTRRYRIEPQAIRVMIRRLGEGRGVGIYPEGERSWDGVIQPFRRGTIRFLLRAGVPIIPCGVAGAYDAWPRWSRSIRRRDIRITFGPALDWPTVKTRSEAEESLEWAIQDLRRALVELGAWSGADSDRKIRSAGEAHGADDL